MTFEMKTQSPIFLHNEEWIEWEQDNYWRKIDRIGNEFLVRLPNSEEPSFYIWLNKFCKEKRK